MIITDIDNLRFTNSRYILIPTYKLDSICTITFYELINNKIVNSQLVSLNHYDSLFNIDISKLILKLNNVNLFCINKKDLLKFNFNNENLIDIKLYHYLETNLHTDYNLEVNDILSLSQIHKLTDDISLSILPIIQSFVLNKVFETYNNEFMYDLHKLELNKININSKLLGKSYSNLINVTHLNSNFNLYTKTGRPSNTNLINLSALTKNSNEREMIISQFKNGSLYEFDYSAYHLSILAKLIKYKIPTGINMHEYLGKQYYGVTELTSEQYSRTKELNFQLLYGNIPVEMLEIDFFNKVSEYIDSIWKLYKKQNYIYSPVTKRKIQNISKVNKNKLLNYLLQLLETEINFKIIGVLNNFLEQYNSKLILYTYDSFLFDILEEEHFLLKQIKDIITKYGFYVTIKSGKNYNNMKKIS